MTSLPVLLLALVLALAGCGGAAQTTDTASQAPSGGDADPDQPVSSGDDGSAAPDADGGTQLPLPDARDVRDGVQEASPRPFERARSDETDDSLHVIYWTGVEPCNVLGDIEVDATADQVTVTLMEGFLPDDDGESPTCIEIAEEVSVRIPLDEVLGDRLLVDGATGEPVPVDVIKMGDAAAS